MFSCFQRIMPKASSRSTTTTRSSFRRTAVSSSCEFIMKPPSPQIATTFFCGCTILVAIAEGRPAPIEASALSSSSEFGSWARQ